MSGSEDCANICGVRAGGACLYRVTPRNCRRFGESPHTIVCSTPVALHPIYTPAPGLSVSDAVLTKARAVENERLLTQRDEAVADAERHRRDAQHHGRLCGRLLDEIEALGYHTDRLLDPTLYAEAMKAAGREVKS